jgi:hypothetical protein
LLGFTPRSGARAPAAAGEVASELARSHAGAYAKGSREIGLGREIQRDGDIEEGLISAHQHLLCALETARTDVLMRGLSDGGLEGPRKVESAQARDLRELSDCKIALEVRCYVFRHSAQPTSIESLIWESYEISVDGAPGMTVHQPRCKTGRERLGEELAGGGGCPQFRDDCESDLGNERILEAPLVSQGCVRRCRIGTMHAPVLEIELDVMALG